MRAKTICFYYVYIITNTLSNKQYVGSHVCYKNNIDDDIYWGSSKSLKKDYEIYGKQYFVKKILKCYDNKNEMLDGETEYILKYDTLFPNGYNKFLPNTRKGFHMFGTNPTEETLNKMRKSHIGLKKTEETKDKIKEKRKHQVFSDETKNKISISHTGKTQSEITKNKKRISMLGKNIGKKLNKEQIEKRKNIKKIKCPYCNKEYFSHNYYLWHGENCKCKN
jgi:hypothetical protein